MRRELLSQFRERRLDASEYRGLSKLREYPLCFSQMLKRERALFLDLVKDTENQVRATRMKALRINTRVSHDPIHPNGYVG